MNVKWPRQRTEGILVRLRRACSQKVAAPRDGLTGEQRLQYICECNLSNAVIHTIRPFICSGFV